MGDVLPSDESSDHGSMQRGARLGRYELLVPIARGGMARVWAARLHGQRGFQKLVAIKTILPHLAEEPEFERMFLDEARIASGVHHPNVCEIYELGEERRTLYLAMEWVSGDSFARIITSSGEAQALDPRVVARIVADACAGLHAAHELTDDEGQALGVVHRDLSPHNILLTADGTSKVADFGVAKALGQLHEATSAGQLKGKLSYMAPEQITGAEVDRRSDIFSLGCVLYEATTGHRPFTGDGEHRIMHAVLKGEVAPPTSFLRSYPHDLERIVMRALAPDAAARYPTAERMRFALEEFLARGQLVTQSNVAQVVRERIGEQIDRRKDKIRQASMAAPGDESRDSTWGDLSAPGGSTPSNRPGGDHRSGVKQASLHGSRPSLTNSGRPRSPMPSFSGVPGNTPGFAPSQPPNLSGPTQPSYAPPHGPAAPSSHPDLVQAYHSYPGAAFSHPGHPSMPADSYPSGSAPPQGAPQPMYPYGGPAISSMQQGMPMAEGMSPQGYPVAPQSIQGAAFGGQGPMGPMYGGPPTTRAFGTSTGAHAMPLGFNPNQLPVAQPNAYAYPYPEARANRSSYGIAITVGVLLALVIGVGVFVASRGGNTAASNDGTGSAPNSANASPSAGVATAAPEIAFRLMPLTTSLTLDGRELPPDTRSVSRPPMGKTISLVARAKGYEDTTLFIDFFTKSPMDVVLRPSPTPAATPTPEPRTVERDKPAPAEKPQVAEKPAMRKDPPKTGGSGVRPAPKVDPAVPPNPF